MARLVSVYRSDDYKLERRQLPLEIEDGMKMVIQFKETCIGCEMTSLEKGELERFVQRFNDLDKDEILAALTVSSEDLLNLLAQMVPCVGCRRSVEELFNQLVKCGYPALEPLTVSNKAILSICRNYLFDPKAIYTLFYLHGSKLNTLMDSILKSKKNKRCHLHSLENQKSKSISSWIDTWNLLSQECREECVIVNVDKLGCTLDSYLRKHRFCSECKSKVQRAFNILVGDSDKTHEKTFCPALYDGLRCCPHEKHIHVACETDFIENLIGRAETELLGSRRERHAKTIDVAQEEVLTCLGVHIFERLHCINQKLKIDEQTWQILFYLGVGALKKNFEMAMERKQGMSNLELLCEELLEEERVKEHKKEQKRQKKKKRKTKQVSKNEEEKKEDKENIECLDVSPDARYKHTCSSIQKCSISTITRHEACIVPCNQPCLSPSSSSSYHSGADSVESKESCMCTHTNNTSATHTNTSSTMQNSVLNNTSRSDCGYSSGLDICDSCSTHSSRESSDVACSEGLCNHEGDSTVCSFDNHITDVPSSKLSPESSCNKDQSSNRENLSNNEVQETPKSMPLSLQSMLEDSCSSDEDHGNGISEEEILSFRANKMHLESKRQQLRETLRRRFDNMCHSKTCQCSVCKCGGGDSVN